MIKKIDFQGNFQPNKRPCLIAIRRYGEVIGVSLLAELLWIYKGGGGEERGRGQLKVIEQYAKARNTFKSPDPRI